MQTASLNDRDHWLERLRQAACFSNDELARELVRLESRAAVSLPLVAETVLDDLTEAASGLPYRPARPEVGKPDRRVYQEFLYCGLVPEPHPVTYLGRWFESCLRRALESLPGSPLAADFSINDIVCQSYRRGDLGITPHRDHASYTGLITLIVLSGEGRYFVCDDRRGHGRREIESGPGWAILMPGPGYAGRSDRPFHGVDRITRHRFSVGLRHDTRKTHAPGTG